MEVGPFGLVLSGWRGVRVDGFAEEEASGHRARDSVGSSLSCELLPPPSGKGIFLPGTRQSRL